MSCPVLPCAACVIKRAEHCAWMNDLNTHRIDGKKCDETRRKRCRVSLSFYPRRLADLRLAFLLSENLNHLQPIEPSDAFQFQTISFKLNTSVNSMNQSVSQGFSLKHLSVLFLYSSVPVRRPSHLFLSTAFVALLHICFPVSWEFPSDSIELVPVNENPEESIDWRLVCVVMSKSLRFRSLGENLA